MLYEFALEERDSPGTGPYPRKQFVTTSSPTTQTLPLLRVPETVHLRS